MTRRTNIGRGHGEQDPAHARLPSSELADVLEWMFHDLRAPLAAITMGTGFLESVQHSADARARRVLKAVLSSCSELDIRLQMAADCVAILEGRLLLRCEASRIHGILLRAAESRRSQAEALNVTLEVQVPGEDISVRCDPAYVVRAVANIVTRALDDAPRGSVIVLTGTPGHSHVLLAVTAPVRDDATTNPDFAESPWRPTAAGRATHPGLGDVGCWIARAFAEAHHGRAYFRGKGRSGQWIVSLPSLPSQAVAEDRDRGG